MRRTVRWLGLALALLIAALSAGNACLGEETVNYVENQWNFVDGSMDISEGIPKSVTEGALVRIREAGVLRVATEPYYPPQEFIDPDFSGQETYQGADMELARTIARKMGVELEIVPMEFTQVLNAVRDGACDLAISALSFTPARASMVEMSKGYNYAGEDAGSALLIREADLEVITGVEDLAGRDIVAQSGSLQETLLAENVFNYHEFRRLGTITEVYEAVRTGDADAAMVDLDSARGYIDGNPECALTLVPNVQFQLEEQFDGDRVAGKKGELALMYFVNGVIDELLASGQYREWYDRYEARAAELGL